jgi:RNA polymerase sigma-70 factor (ECF subfamily)
MSAPAAQLSSDSSLGQSPPVALLDAELRALYAAHAPLVWRTLRRLGVPEEQLEDGVQDVFLVVHRQQGKFEGRSTIKTWIVGIAVRVAKDYRRTEVRYTTRIERLAAHLTCSSDTSVNPCDATEQREASELLHALLARLPDEQREMLVLVELEELTVREASEALGIRVRTGQRRLRAAVEAMSSAVAGYLEQDRRSYP